MYLSHTSVDGKKHCLVSDLDHRGKQSCLMCKENSRLRMT